jgi:hypothetical protein
MVKDEAGEVKGAVAPRPEPLAYDIVESCRLDTISRATKYKAMHEDPAKRGGLPHLPSFTVGRKRLLWAADHREWLQKLRAASLRVGADTAAALALFALTLFGTLIDTLFGGAA